MRAWMLILIPLLLAPMASADISVGQAQQHLVCQSADDCSLSDDTQGLASIGGEALSASPAAPVTVSIDFPMRPDQRHIALLPDVISAEFDLSVGLEGGGTWKPELHVELALGPSQNHWVLDGETVIIPTTDPGYRLDEVALDLAAGRLLESGDQVHLRLSFDLDRPSRWTLNLGASSWVEMPVSWSIDPLTSNPDEPTSADAPGQIGQIDEASIDAGLMGNDVDCYAFELDGGLASLTIRVEWDAAPLEVEQPKSAPELYDERDASVPNPSVRTSHEGSLTVNEIRWIEPAGGDYTLCWVGQTDRYQTYSFSARTALLGIGSTSPEEFTGQAVWEGGLAHAGHVQELEEVGGAGLAMMVAASAGIAAAGAGMFLPTSTPWLKRLYLPLAILCLMGGGVVSPAFAQSVAAPTVGDVSLDEALENRLDRIAQGIRSGDAAATGPMWYGGLLGLAPGESLQLRMEVEGAHPLGDGRWQLHTAELQEVDLDRLIFDRLRDAHLSHDDEIRFILRAGRLLTLDLLMLEALLVTESEPRGDVVRVHWEMERAPLLTDQAAPVWSSKPAGIAEDDWRILAEAVYPDLLSISYCDCGIDAIELSMRPKEVHTRTLVTPGGVEMASGLITIDTWIATVGFLALGMAAWVESRRRRSAMEIADRMLG